MFTRIFSFLVVLGLISACGGTTGAKDTGLKLGNLGYQEMGTGNNLTHNGTSVAGDGLIRFASQTPGGQGNKVEIDFALQDGGYIDLIMNSRSDLGNAIHFTIQ